MTAQGLSHHPPLAQVMLVLVQGTGGFAVQKVAAIVALHTGELPWIVGVSVTGCERTLTSLHGWRRLCSALAPVCVAKVKGDANCAPRHNTLLRMGCPCCVERDPGLLNQSLGISPRGEALCLWASLGVSSSRPWFELDPGGLGDLLVTLAVQMPRGK